jgi:hypothetical protein
VSEVFVPYRDFEVPGGQIVGRPVVTVEFRTRHGSFTHPMLVDTGADNIVIASELMHLLGVTEDDCTRVAGNTFFGVAEGLQYEGVSLSFPDYWEDRSFTAPVIFSPLRDRTAYGLLGREPVLDVLHYRFGHDEGYGFRLGFARPKGRRNRGRDALSVWRQAAGHHRRRLCVRRANGRPDSASEERARAVLHRRRLLHDLYGHP